MKKKIIILLPVMLGGKMYRPGMDPKKPTIVNIAEKMAAELVDREIAEYVKESAEPPAK